jgi:hypothetical protein
MRGGKAGTPMRQPMLSPTVSTIFGTTPTAAPHGRFFSSASALPVDGRSHSVEPLTRVDHARGTSALAALRETKLPPLSTSHGPFASLAANCDAKGSGAALSKPNRDMGGVTITKSGLVMPATSFSGTDDSNAGTSLDVATSTGDGHLTALTTATATPIPLALSSPPRYNL